MTSYINGSMLVCFVQVYNCKAVKRNMESKGQYVDFTPLTYPSATPGPSAYPAPAAAPGPTPYPPPGPHQHQQQSQYPPPAQQYPPASGPPAYGQVYGYDQPPAGYPPQPGYGAPQGHSQQQQQQVVVVSAVQRLALVGRHVISYAGHIIFALFVMWICNPLIGFVAFILAG